MTEPITHKPSWPLAGVSIGLSSFGLSAVPFVGTKYGDWPEAGALAIGLLPLIFLGIHVAVRTNVRLASMESRLHKLEGGGK
jgi:hypothetical protein